MMLPSSRRTPNDIGSPYFPYDPARFPTEQDCESTIPISFLFTVNFKRSLLSSYVYEIILYMM